MAYVEKAVAQEVQEKDVLREPNPVDTNDVKESLATPEVDSGFKQAVFEATHKDPNRLTMIANDQGDFNYASLAIKAFVEYDHEEAPKLNYMDIVAPDDQLSVKEAYGHAKNGELVRIVVRVITKTGDIKLVEATFSQLSTGDIIISITDTKVSRNEFDKVVKERDEAREKSLYDAFTGLYSKYHIKETMEELKGKRSNIFPISALYMDGDKFKAVNDTYGHAAGDKVIMRTGKIIAETIRGEDIAARFGGDEFLILLPFTDEDDVKDLISRLNVAINESNADEGWDLPDISISMGYSVARNREELNSLIHKADEAMYDEKNDRKKHQEQPHRVKSFARAALNLLAGISK